MVNEPGTLPDLSLTGTCGLSTVSPGQPITLTASILDHHLQPLVDPATQVKATLYLTPTWLYSNTVTLPYCDTCGGFQSVLNLPATVPSGNYQVDFVATHPGYDPDRTTGFFFVTPPLTMTVTIDRASADVLDTLPLTAQVFDRGTFIREASVLAQISTPLGVITAPLMYRTGVT